jgi:hypothetical protein
MQNVVSNEVRVFFSWQSDSPGDTNSYAIRSALNAVARVLEEKYVGIRIVCDEATRDTSGAPNIADKIVEKIDAAHVYIADITTVTPPGSERPCANPNVLIELGYAVAQVGWDRTILLFNEGIGNFPGDLPFDIIQNRVSKYRIAAGTKAEARKNAISSLHRLLEVAIQAVIDKNPKTPIQLRGLAPEKIEHERDVENLNWLLSQAHIPTLDDHIAGLPRYLRDRVFWFWEGFKGVVTNSLFHIYDPVLEEAIVGLFSGWQKTLAFPGVYNNMPSGDYVFANPGDAPLDKEQEPIWQQIEAGSVEMAKGLRMLLDRVRSAYIEVNVKDTNTQAWRQYQEEKKKLDEIYGN